MRTYYLVPRSRRRLSGYQPVSFNGGRRLPLDLQANGDEFVLTAEVPGLKPEDLQIEILDDVLTVRAEMESDEVEKQGGYLLRELHHGSFVRRLRLPEPVEAEKAEAKVEDGLLIVRIPKSEEARPKEIKVKAR